MASDSLERRESTSVSSVSVANADSNSDDNDSGGLLSFFDALSSHAKDGDFMMSIASTSASKLPNITVVSEEGDSNEFSSDSGEKEDWFDAMEDDVDDYMASAVASFASGMMPEHLSKVWRISHEEAK